MRKWKHELNLKDVWNDGEWTDENVHELGRIIAQRMKRLSKHFEETYEWEEILESMDCICTVELADELNEDNEQWHYDNNQTGEFHPIDPLEEFNGWMAALYDFADSEDIWINK